MNEILIMTGAINVDKNLKFHNFINQQERVNQYLKSILYYLTESNFSTIIFCDGTGYKLTEFEPLKIIAKQFNKSIEFLSFEQDGNKVLEKGKGYGEAIIIEYIINNSNLLSAANSFFKVTGRYIIKNINIIIKNEINKENIFFRTSILDRNNCNTAFFKCKKEFYLKNLVGAGEGVNDLKGYYLEHEFMKRVKGKSICSFKNLPIFSGTAGSGGILDLPKHLMIIKQFCNLIGLHKIKGK